MSRFFSIFLLIHLIAIDSIIPKGEIPVDNFTLFNSFTL